VYHSEQYPLTISTSHFNGNFNTTLYGHFFMVRHGYTVSTAQYAHERNANTDEEEEEGRKETNVVYVIRPLTKLMPHLANITRNLLDESNNAGNSTANETATISLLPKRAPMVSHWKSQMPLQVVNDYNRYPFGKLPADFAQLYQFDR
jgi:hypothetical protein